MGIVFEVPGEPRGKGRPRFSGGHAYTDSETRAYENKIIAYYRQQLHGYRWSDEAFISIEVTAVLPIPKRVTQAARAGMQTGRILPSRKPDVDNVLKVVLDALNGVAYKDDARVVAVSAKKIYGVAPKLIVEMKGAD